MRTFLFSMMLIAPLVLAAAESTDEKPTKAYRWVAEDGSVVFSTTPPPPGVDAETIELRDPDIVIQQDKREIQRLINRSKAMDHQINLRIERRETLRRQLAATEDELVKAQQAVEEGKAPLPSELKHLAGGGTKLGPKYFERQQRLQEDVGRLEQRIETLNEEINKLR